MLFAFSCFSLMEEGEKKSLKISGVLQSLLQINVFALTEV